MVEPPGSAAAGRFSLPGRLDANRQEGEMAHEMRFACTRLPGRGEHNVPTRLVDVAGSEAAADGRQSLVRVGTPAFCGHSANESGWCS